MSSECCRCRHRCNHWKLRNYLAFWCFGLGNNFSYVIMLSAAVDIIRKQDSQIEFTTNISTYHINCTKIGTGSVLLADILPSMIFKFISPIFIQKLHFQSCISAWACGTGAAGLIGSLYYVSLTSITTPEITLCIVIVVPCTTLLVYFFVLDRPHHEKFRLCFNPIVSSDNSTMSTERINALVTSEEPEHTEIDDDNDVITDSDGYIQLRNEDDMVYHDNSQVSNYSSLPVLHQQQPTWKIKLQLLKGMISSLFCLVSVYFFEYLINQSLFELLYFQNTRLTAPEQYRWYQVLYQIGVFLSRSSVSFIQFKTTWIMSLLQAMNFVICLLQVIYSYIPYIWIMFIVIFCEGCLGGLTYVNTFYNILQETSPIYRESAMAMATVSDSIGVAGAGFLSIYLHNWLCNILI
ncbi:unnamed protein product [Schistosoma bovis]|nr:unnamed protein product [Schistosoma bovis]